MKTTDRIQKGILCLLAVAIFVPTAHAILDFGLTPNSPETPGTFSPGDLINPPGTAVQIPAADLGLSAGENVNAFSYGKDEITPLNTVYFYTRLAYSVKKPAIGNGAPIETQVSINGAAGDTFALDFVGTGNMRFVVRSPFLLTESQQRNLTPTPDESDIDGLGLGRGQAGYPVYLTFPPGGTHNPADIYIVRNQGGPPEVFATASQLGLVAGDVIDGLALGPVPFTGAPPDELNPNMAIWVTLAEGSPTRTIAESQGGDGVIEVWPGGPALVLNAQELKLDPEDEVNALAVLDPGEVPESIGIQLENSFPKPLTHLFVPNGLQETIWVQFTTPVESVSLMEGDVVLEDRTPDNGQDTFAFQVGPFEETSKEYKVTATDAEGNVVQYTFTVTWTGDRVLNVDRTAGPTENISGEELKELSYVRAGDDLLAGAFVFKRGLSGEQAVNENVLWGDYFQNDQPASSPQPDARWLVPVETATGQLVTSVQPESFALRYLRGGANQSFAHAQNAPVSSATAIAAIAARVENTFTPGGGGPEIDPEGSRPTSMLSLYELHGEDEATAEVQWQTTLFPGMSDEISPTDTHTIVDLEFLSDNILFIAGSSFAQEISLGGTTYTGVEPGSGDAWAAFFSLDNQFNLTLIGGITVEGLGSVASDFITAADAHMDESGLYRMGVGILSSETTGLDIYPLTPEGKGDSAANFVQFTREAAGALCIATVDPQAETMEERVNVEVLEKGEGSFRPSIDVLQWKNAEELVAVIKAGRAFSFSFSDQIFGEEDDTEIVAMKLGINNKSELVLHNWLQSHSPETIDLTATDAAINENTKQLALTGFARSVETMAPFEIGDSHFRVTSSGGENLSPWTIRVHYDDFTSGQGPIGATHEGQMSFAQVETLGDEFAIGAWTTAPGIIYPGALEVSDPAAVFLDFRGVFVFLAGAETPNQPPPPVTLRVQLERNAQNEPVLKVTFADVSGGEYEILAAEGFPANWEAVQTVTADESGSVELNLPIDEAEDSHFYQVRSKP